jgi:hypothetical protein
MIQQDNSAICKDIILCVVLLPPKYVFSNQIHTFSVHSVAKLSTGEGKIKPMMLDDKNCSIPKPQN